MSTSATPNRLLRILLASGAAAGLGWSAPALATEAVVPPLVSNGVDPLIVLNLTSLISSEMDFMGEFDSVTQLDKMPSGMGAQCLGSAGCLGGVASGAGTDALVGGAVSAKGNKFDLYLVYYNGGRIVRSKEYTVANVPSVIADSMSGYIRELVTGESPTAQAAVAAGTVDADFFEDEDDDMGMVAVPTGGNSRRISTPVGSGGSSELDDFDFDADPADERRRAREEEARRAAELAAQREREAEERRRQEEAARQEEERRRALALAAQREREEEERRAAAAAAAQDEPEDDLVFGDSEITFAVVPMQLDDEPMDEDEEDYGGGGYAMLDDEPEPARASRERPTREPRERPVREPRERPERESRSSSYRDLDADSRTKTTSRSSSGGDAPTAVAAARLGYANFQGLNFVTYGAEVSFMATKTLAILAGVEAYSTRRAMPAELIDAGAPPEVWNTILPFNLGLAYRFSTKSVQPYAGGDFIMIPGYVKDTGGVATGLRIRGGSDFLVTDSFGFNLNVSMGVWAGSNFEQVETAASNAALTPQFSGGTVLHF